MVPDEPATFDLGYQFENDKVTITAVASDGAVGSTPAALVVPIVSASGEEVRQVSDSRIEIDKPGGTVIVESNVPLSIKNSEKGRVFNMVPGMEAVPIIARLPDNAGVGVECKISVI